MNKIYLLVGSLCCLLTSVQAQRPDSIPTRPNEYIEVMEPYLLSSQNKEMEDTWKEFKTYLGGGAFDEQQFQRIYKVSSRMLEERMSANPHYLTYYQALMEIQGKAKEGLFGSWHAVADTMLSVTEDRSTRDFKAFTDFTVSFLKTGLLRGGGVDWEAKSPDFELVYDKDPLLRFAETDIMATRNDDSISIAKTSGTYYILDDKWQGEGGRISWERVGLDSTVYAELEAYEIDTRRSLYEAPRARLHYPQFFDNNMVAGSFTDKLINMNAATEASYPRFISDVSEIEIKNFGEGIEYQGGFSLQGTTIYGLGTKERKAKVRILNNRGQLVYRGSSEKFIVRRGERIVGEGVESTFYYQQDSIYHPSVNLRYDIENHKLELVRGQGGTAKNPFLSSVHRTNIDTDYLTVFPDQDSVILGKKSISTLRKDPVIFESQGYFSKAEYNSIQGIASVNPIAMIKRAGELHGNLLSADEVAKVLNPKFSVENIQTQLFDLAAKGFVDYDSETNQVFIRQKVYHYANAARELSDYDNLRFSSVTPEVNATMNLKNNDIQINGVEKFEFSRRQRVGALPDSNNLILKANRNLELAGKVFAGFSEFSGKDFHFKYDDFKIEMDSVERFRFFVPEKRPSEDPQTAAYALNSDIEDFQGVLLIDAPNNKGGKEDIPIFPSFKSSSPAYVYYDTDKVQDTVYVRDSFFYELKPFAFGPLDNYIRPDLKFEGSLKSASIFPDFEEELIVRDDYSLGFVHETPEEGYDAYQGKGTYSGKIDLSNKGLRGEGNLKYLGASVDATDFVLRPLELKANSETFDLAEDRSGEHGVPQVHGEDVNIQWRPYQDSMYIRSEEAPFELFQEDEHSLQGMLTLTPGGLKGDGLLDWSKANMTSAFFEFSANGVKADTTTVKIKALEEQDAVAIATENIKGDVDFDEQMGYFKANEAFLETSLPYNKYITTMNEFIWDMADEGIAFKADSSKLGTFTSTHPDQDSLFFMGRRADYDLKSYLLNIQEVPRIASADAYVFPDSGLVEIQPGGVMTELLNAVIVVDTINQNHKIKRATVNIQGRKDYKASGFYEYNVAGREQEIEFSEIVGGRVGKGKYDKKRTATRAQGELLEQDSFYIDHKTTFFGNISLSSENVNLKFDGYARLKTENIPDPRWFRVNSEGVKENLVIEFDEPKDLEGYPLNTGFYLSKETAVVYPRVIMPLYFRKDRPILPVKGVFKYNQPADQFIFGDSSKVINNDYRGNKLIYNDLNGSLVGEGKLELGSGMAYLDIDAVGEIRGKFRDASMPDSVAMQTPPPAVDIDIMAGLKFIVPEKLLRIMENEIQAAGFGMEAIPFLTNMEKYKKGLSMLFPPSKDMDKTLAELSTGLLNLPKNEYTLLFSDLKLKWDMDYQSFVTSTPKAGLMSISGNPVNKTVEVNMEIKMPTNEDDRLYMHMKLPNDIYYYFGYKQGILELNSNDNRFMDAASNMKGKDLIHKMGGGETYEIVVEEAGRAKMFLRRAQAAGG